MKRYAMLFAAVFVFLLLSGVAVSEAATARLSVQITLYDLEQDAGQPVAVGKAALTGIEQKAQLFSVSSEPGQSGQTYDRDVFYVTRTGRDIQTGATRFRADGQCGAWGRDAVPHGRAIRNPRAQRLRAGGRQAWAQSPQAERGVHAARTHATSLVTNCACASPCATRRGPCLCPCPWQRPSPCPGSPC